MIISIDTMHILEPLKKTVDLFNSENKELIARITELTELRKSISLELKSIATATKISTHQLKNIEALNFEKLPPQPMRESFINQYCEQIQIAKKSS